MLRAMNFMVVGCLMNLDVKVRIALKDVVLVEVSGSQCNMVKFATFIVECYAPDLNPSSCIRFLRLLVHVSFVGTKLLTCCSSIVNLYSASRLAIANG